MAFQHVISTSTVHCLFADAASGRKAGGESLAAVTTCAHLCHAIAGFSHLPLSYPSHPLESACDSLLQTAHRWRSKLPGTGCWLQLLRNSEGGGPSLLSSRQELSEMLPQTEEEHNMEMTIELTWLTSSRNFSKFLSPIKQTPMLWKRNVELNPYKSREIRWRKYPLLICARWIFSLRHWKLPGDPMKRTNPQHLFQHMETTSTQHQWEPWAQKRNKYWTYVQ